MPYAMLRILHIHITDNSKFYVCPVGVILGVDTVFSKTFDITKQRVRRYMQWRGNTLKFMEKY